MIKQNNLISIKRSMEEASVVEMVESASEEIWHRLPDVTAFEHTCYVNIGKEIEKGVRQSVEAVAHYYIERAKARHLARIKYKPPQYFSSLIAENTESGEEEFDIEDTETNVESEIIKKETEALLAQGDRRKEKIIEHWSMGNTNSRHISRELARSLGGNEESHRKYIQRFRKSCEEILIASV